MVVRMMALLCAAASSACQSEGNQPPQTRSPKAEAKAPQAFLDKQRKNLKFVEGGSFQMGDFGPLHSEEKLYYSSAQDNKPLHKVSLNSFSMAAYKITYEDHDVYAKTTGAPQVGMEREARGYRHPKIAASLVTCND